MDIAACICCTHGGGGGGWGKLHIEMTMLAAIGDWVGVAGHPSWQQLVSPLKEELWDYRKFAHIKGTMGPSSSNSALLTFILLKKAFEFYQHTTQDVENQNY